MSAKAVVVILEEPCGVTTIAMVVAEDKDFTTDVLETFQRGEGRVRVVVVSLSAVTDGNKGTISQQVLIENLHGDRCSHTKHAPFVTGRTLDVTSHDDTDTQVDY